MSIRERWDDLVAETTAHGITHLKRRHGSRKILFWYLVSVITTVFLSYHISVIIKAYLNYDVSIEVKFEGMHKADFPAVTFCNANPINKSAIQDVVQDGVLSVLLDDTHERPKREVNGSHETNELQDNASAKMAHGRTRIFNITHSSNLKDATTTDSTNPGLRGHTNDTDRNNMTHDIVNFTKENQRVVQTEHSVGSDVDLSGHPDPDISQAGVKSLEEYNAPGVTNNKQSTANNADTINDLNTPETATTAEITPTNKVLAIGGHRPPFFMMEEDPTMAETGQESEIFQEQEKVTDILASLPLDVRTRLGYQKEEFFQDCLFDGRVVDIDSNFKLMVNPYHGNCYTFNFAGTGSLAFNTSKTGRRFGLQCTMNIHQEENLQKSSIMAGVVALVHRRDEMPFPEDYGHMLHPGEFSLLALRQSLMKRMTQPYGDCVDSRVSDHSRNFYSIENKNVKYSKSACLKTCHQRLVVEKCGCALPRVPYPNDSIPQCLDSKIDRCLLDTESLIAQSHEVCFCPEVCRENVYTKTLSRAAWPASVVLDNTDGSMTEKHIATNLLKISVYFETLQVEIIEEIPIYTVAKFICDIGSVLGLWMGMSFVSLMELMEFTAQMCCVGIGRFRPGSDKSVTLESPPKESV